MGRTIKTCYRSGQRQHELHLDNDGRMHGTSHSWYENGRLMSEDHYMHGQPHGMQLKWHENGQLAEVSEFRYGIPHGTSREWDETGRLVQELEFDNGRIIAQGTETPVESRVKSRKL